MTPPDTPENSSSSGGPGAELAKARRRNRIALADVARELKLPRTTVEHIEADRFDEIAPIYRRGYVTNYARVVGLDPQPLLEQLGNLEPEPLRPVLPVARNGQRFDRFLKFATYALVTTMIVPPLVYFFVLGGARLFESGVASRSPEPAGTAQSVAGKPGYRERFADALSVQADDADEGDESHLSASTLPLKPIRNAPEPDTATGDDAADGAAESDDGDVESDLRATLELELSEDSWVEIESADGQRLEFDLLRAGQARQYAGRPPFRLLLGRANAVALTLDGEAVEFDGDDAAGVAELVLGEPPSGDPDSSLTSGRMAE